MQQPVTPPQNCGTAALGCAPHSARVSAGPCARFLRRTANNAHSVQRVGVAPARFEPFPHSRARYVALQAVFGVLGGSV